MSVYHIGRRLSIGVAHETTRGVYKVAQYWIPKISASLDDKINTVTHDSSVGTIADAENQEVVNTYSEGSIEARASDVSMGCFLLATLGTETSQSAHAGESAVYDHIFNVAETATHESLSVSVSGPNESTGLAYTRAMVDTFEFAMEVGKYATYKVGWRADKNAAQTTTASFLTTERAFTPQLGVVKFASTQAGLTAASAITIRKCALSIKKNTEDDFNIGALPATDRVNKQFAIEGTLELVYKDRTYIDTDMIADLAQAMRISAVDTTKYTTATSTGPAIQFDLYKVKISEVARKIDNDSIVTQTIKFKAFYSLTDAKMVTVTLVNQLSTAY